MTQHRQMVDGVVKSQRETDDTQRGTGRDVGVFPDQVRRREGMDDGVRRQPWTNGMDAPTSAAPLCQSGAACATQYCLLR